MRPNVGQCNDRVVTTNFANGRSSLNFNGRAPMLRR
jgi:hypothetical protein